MQDETVPPEEALVDELVRTIARDRARIPPKLRKQLSPLLQPRSGGFRDVFRTSYPEKWLVEDLHQLLQRLPTISDLLLELWAALKSDAIHRVRTALREGQQPSPTTLPGLSSQEIALALRQLSRTEATLHRTPAAASGSTAPVPEPAREPAPTTELRAFPDPLRGFLDTLDSLPSDAELWDEETISRFLAEVDAIARRKREEGAERRLLQRLRDALQMLQQELPSETRDWDVSHCPPERRAEALAGMRSLLDSWWVYRQKSEAARGLPIAEQAGLHEELARLAGHLSATLNQLAPLLSASVAGPAALPAPPESSELLPETHTAEQAPQTPEEVPPSPARAEDTIATSPDAGPTTPAGESAADTTLRLLVTGDLEGAYWAARAREQDLGEPPAAPSPLIATVVASRWLLARPDLASDPKWLTELKSFITEARQLSGLGNADVEAALRLAAAVPLVLFHPELGLLDWLEEGLEQAFPRLRTAVQPVVEAVRQFSIEVGRTLNCLEYLDPAAEEQIEERIHQAAGAAADWLKEAGQRRVTSYLPACKVFWNLLRPEGGLDDLNLYRLLDPVARDQRASLAEVKRRAQALQNPGELDRLFQRVMTRVTGKHTPREIEGAALRSLRQEVGTAVEIARRWVELVERRDTGRDRSDFARARVQKLREFFNEQVPATLDHLRAIARSSSDPSASLSRLVADAVEGIQARLAGQTPQHLAAPPDSALCGLMGALSLRLLQYPFLQLTQDPAGMPLPAGPQGWRQLREALSAEPVSWDKVADALLDRGDLRWTDWVLKQLPPDHHALYVSRFDSLEERRRKLRKEAQTLLREIEHGFTDGSVRPDERADLSGRVQAVLQELDRRAVPLNELEDRLGNLRSRLSAVRDEKTAEQRRDWDALQKRLRHLLGEGREFTRLKEYVERGLRERRTIRVAEILARIHTAVDRQAPEEIAGLLLADQENDGVLPLEEFHDCADDLANYLETAGLEQAEQEIRSGQLPPPLRMNGLPRERVQEVAEAFGAWHRLKLCRNPGELRGAAPRDDLAYKAGADLPLGRADLWVYSLLRYLGFRPEARHEVRLVNRGREWALFTAPAGQVSAPVPEFGSYVRERGLSVLVVWGSPDAARMAAILTEAGLRDAHGYRPTVVFYMDRLTSPLRYELGSWAYQNRCPWALLDDILLAFLARARDRLHLFFACALPITGINPYQPDAEANLPPEMFVGREQLIQDLIRPDGPTYVYGGRKLGKSSLLGQVRLRFHRPEEEQVALLMSLRDLSSEPPEALWAMLVRRLSQLLGRVQPRPPRTQDPQRLRDWLRTLLLRNPRLRVLALLDEADAFLSRDAEHGFRIVGALHTLMQETQRRFRVILAGLHTVRRFHGLPNHPLVGQPCVVGPLQPREAWELVVQRMGLLGFRVQEEAFLDLMALTNYHPALIQLVCQRLINTIRQSKGGPPFHVTPEIAEQVARDPEVEKTIQDRFRITIALDPHYHVLTLAMVLDQMDTPNGFSRAYSLSELRDLCSHHWPEGFQDLPLPRLRDYAEELREMHVLAPAEGDRYRLRSPNLVRMLGTRDELEEMLRLHREGPSTMSPSPDIHPAITMPHLCLSPFSLDQLQALDLRGDAGTPRVAVVLGTRLTGLDAVQQWFESLKNVRQDIVAVNTLTAVPFHLGDALRHADQEIQESGGHIFLLRPRISHEERTLDLLWPILRDYSRHRKARGWTYLVLLLDAPGIDQWVLLPRRERERLESEVQAIVPLAPWSRYALEHLLRLLELPPDRAHKLLDLSCGYHALVVAALQRVSGTPSPEALDQAFQQLHADLQSPGSAIRSMLDDAFALPAGSELRRVAQKCLDLLAPAPDERGALLDVLDVLGGEEDLEKLDALLTALEWRGILLRDGPRMRVSPFFRLSQSSLNIERQ